MKQNILLFLAFISLNALVAQEMEFIDSPVILNDVTSDMFEGIGHTTLLNTAEVVRDLRWTLNVVDIETGWQVAVCDQIQCYDPLTTTAVFPLEPDSMGRMDVHVYPGGRDGYAIIELSVVDTLDQNAQVSNLYYFNADPSSTGNEIRQDRVQVYPNPSNGLFSIKGDKGIASVHVYNLTGAEVSSFQYDSNQAYDISNLVKGTYLVRLIDRKGQEVVTKLINKL